MKKLNLASGQRPFPKPWINIDIRDQGYVVDLVADITNLETIEDNSVDVAVAHHVLEHIDMSRVGDVAKEWNRILKPGGKLLVCVPNNKTICERYLAGQVDDFTFNVNMYGAYQGYPEDLHRWSYNADYLIKQMGDIWSKATPFPQVDIGGLYQGADIAVDWWILIVEFTK